MVLCKTKLYKIFSVTNFQAFKVPDTPICLARWRNKEGKSNKSCQEQVRHFVISYLAQGLERNLYQVNRHFLTEYGGAVKGPYSEYEEKIVQICVHHCPKNAVVYLSAILSREPRNIYKRLHQICDGEISTRYYLFIDI